MTKVRFSLKALTLAVFMLAFSALAHAQATRTWVSGVGDDVNPCSRTAPCKTFAGAISKTADKGEIDALDPGGFGTVTITKSITLDGTTGAGFGSILAAGTNGVNVNDSASGAANTHIVHLRNLSIDGAGTGLRGINFTSAKQLYVENCIVFNFKGNGASSNGIDFNPTTGGAVTFNLNVKDSIFQDNAGDGIRVNTASATINASVDNCVLSGNTNGLNVPGGTVNISRSVIDNNSANGITVTNGAFVNASSNQITSNGTGINNAASNVRISDNNVYRNGTGLGGGGTYVSFGNNHVFGNTSDGITPGLQNPK
jgi:hypothetical protein